MFLARALAQEAELYLLDEPFAGVDAATERAIVDVLRELRAAGKSVIAVHHDLSTVAGIFRPCFLGQCQPHCRRAGGHGVHPCKSARHLWRAARQQRPSALRRNDRPAGSPKPASRLITRHWSRLAQRCWAWRRAWPAASSPCANARWCRMRLPMPRWPGIALAFMVMVALGGDGRSLAGLLLGAALSGGLGLLAMTWITTRTRLAEDAAIGAVLGVFFRRGRGAADIGPDHARGSSGGAGRVFCWAPPPECCAKMPC